MALTGFPRGFQIRTHYIDEKFHKKTRFFNLCARQLWLPYGCSTKLQIAI